MSVEFPHAGAPEPAPDQTLSAIYEVAKTMGGDGGGAAEQPPKSAEAASGPATDPTSSAAEQLLIDKGVLGKSGIAQRAALGCMACQLNKGPADEQGATLRQMARCGDRDAHPIRRLLQRLQETGMIASATDATSNSISAKDRYVVGPAGKEAGLDKALQPPSECGLETPRDTTNVAAEQALIEAGAVDYRSPTRRAALGCIACRINAGEDGVHAQGVKECRGISHATAIKTFGPLVEKGALEAYEEEGRPTKGRRRVIYAPTYSPLGTKLRELLEAPESCGLEEQQPRDHEQRD
jgi:hypothetical protein